MEKYRNMVKPYLESKQLNSKNKDNKEKLKRKIEDCNDNISNNVENYNAINMYNKLSDYNQKNNNICNQIMSLVNNKSYKLKTITRTTVKYFENLNINIIDVKFNYRAEDKVYEDNEDARKFIRRGNTLLASAFKNINNDTNKDNCKLYAILRKGLPKFFDYNTNFEYKNSKQKDIVMNPIINYYSNNNDIHNETNNNPLYVYKTYKANGENFQIAFNNILDSWIVCSKNVGMIVRDKLYEQDLLYYESLNLPEYDLCIYFAKQWLSSISNINKDKLTVFKEKISGKTLIGESIGDPKRIHIKVYQNPELRFYAIVDNENTVDPCLPFEESINFFKEYNLNVVDFRKSNPLYTLQDFYNYCSKLYQEVLFSPINKDGEGSVCYFSAYNTKRNEYTVLNLAKLKTFEYRILRKIREKMHYFSIEHSKDLVKYCNKIKNECSSFFDFDKDNNYDYSGYIVFSYFIFSYLKRKQIFMKECSNYGSFIDKKLVEFNSLYSNVSLTVFKKANKNDSDKYNILDEKIINSYMNNSDISNEDDNSQHIEFTNNNNFDNVSIDSDGNKNTEAAISLIKNTNCIKDFNNININDKLTTLKPYLIINIGLVGGGKSTVYKLIKDVLSSNEYFNFKDYINLFYVSSDEIMLEKQVEFVKQYPQYKIGDNDIFEKLRGTVNNLFDNNVKNYLNMFNKDSNKYHFIFLDKNYPVNQLFKIYSMYKSSNVEYDVIIMYPNITDPLLKYNIPYSLNYLVQCYNRIKSRKHETLDGLNTGFYLILYFFIALNKSNKCIDVYIKNNKKLLSCKLSMTDNNSDLNEYSDLALEVKQSLGNIANMKNNILFDHEKFIKEYRSDNDLVKNYFEQICKDIVFKETYDTIKKELSLCKVNIIILIIYLDFRDVLIPYNYYNNNKDTLASKNYINNKNKYSRKKSELSSSSTKEINNNYNNKTSNKKNLNKKRKHSNENKLKNNKKCFLNNKEQYIGNNLNNNNNNNL